MQREYWHLTEGLIFVHFAVFILTATNSESLSALALFPGQIASRPWTLVTFQFIHGQSMFWFFISMLVLWIMARPLEDSWGSPRFLVFWLVSTLGASGTAAVIGLPLGGDVFLSASLLFTFATVYPEVEFRLFFIIPVKVKYLAIVAGAFLVFSGLSFGLGAGAAYVVGMSAGYLFFLATRRLPTRRKLAFEFKKRRATAAVNAENTRTEEHNREWDPRVRNPARRARRGQGSFDHRLRAIRVRFRR